MVESAPLLREYTSNGIEGSNPSRSAIREKPATYNGSGLSSFNNEAKWHVKWHVLPLVSGFIQNDLFVQNRFWRLIIKG